MRRTMSRRRGIGAGSALAALAVLFVASSALGASWNVPAGWTNGTVLCQFGPTTPQVAVSALSVPESGLITWLVGVSEVRGDGSVAAAADLAGRAWNVANLSTDDAYDLAFTISVPIDAGATGGGTVGSVNLSVQFVLPAYDGSPNGSVDQVTAVFAESGWSWQGIGDHLLLTLGAAPSFPSSSHLSASTESGWTIVGQANATGADQERLGVSATANATASNGSTLPVSASSSLDLTSPQAATIAVSFGTSAGEFTNLSFTTRVGVVLPSTVAGIPLPDLAAAVGAGVLVSVLVAVGARRVRRRPSRLIYAEEEP